MKQLHSSDTCHSAHAISPMHGYWERWYQCEQIAAIYRIANAQFQCKCIVLFLAAEPAYLCFARSARRIVHAYQSPLPTYVPINNWQ